MLRANANEFYGFHLSSSLTSVHPVPELTAFLFRLSLNSLQWEWDLYTLYVLFVTTTVASVNVMNPMKTLKCTVNFQKRSVARLYNCFSRTYGFRHFDLWLHNMLCISQ